MEQGDADDMMNDAQFPKTQEEPTSMMALATPIGDERTAKRRREEEELRHDDELNSIIEAASGNLPQEVKREIKKKS